MSTAEQLELKGISEEDKNFLASLNLPNHIKQNIVSKAIDDQTSCEKSRNKIREEDGDSAWEKLGTIKE